MWLNSDRDHQFDALAAKIRAADAAAPQLMADIIAQLCARLPLLNRNGNAAVRIEKLIRSGAWLDAGLDLINIELPGWALRRLAYDSGEWHCALSREPNLPAEIDNTIDATHTVPALAILAALVEARRSLVVQEAETSTIPTLRGEQAQTICCDNFA